MKETLQLKNKINIKIAHCGKVRDTSHSSQPPCLLLMFTKTFNISFHQMYKTERTESHVATNITHSLFIRSQWAQLCFASIVLSNKCPSLVTNFDNSYDWSHPKNNKNSIMQKIKKWYNTKCRKGWKNKDEWIVQPKMTTMKTDRQSHGEIIEVDNHVEGILLKLIYIKDLENN